MKRRMLCAAMALALLATMLSGCVKTGLLDWMDQRPGHKKTAYADMVYTRPDMETLENALLEVCRLAEQGEDIGQVVDGIYDFYDLYDDFYTNYYLADIKYSSDLTNTYWDQEYSFCMENAGQADAGLEELYYALAQSPLREELEGEDYFGQDFFDSYDGESPWSGEFLALLEEEARLQSQYYTLSQQAQSEAYYSDAYFAIYGSQMAELFVELVAVRQKLAASMGYDSYPQFAYDFYYERDYTPQQAEACFEEIGKELVPLYRQVNDSDIWDTANAYCTEGSTFRYVQQTAKHMGGQTQEAFTLLQEQGLYDIGYGENKYSASFEVYLPSYHEPFIFMNPEQTQLDQLTFAHEFGHFVGDYVSDGSYASSDVAEIHSQAMEYLSLCYGDGREGLEQVKLADGLTTHVEQAAYGLFEHQVYSLQADALTVENVQALYEGVGLRFGFDSWEFDPRDYVTIGHFYTNPMYIVSYVVSNDAALQIYQLEKAEQGAGLAVYQQGLSSEESCIVAFTQQQGLTSPMAAGRAAAVRKTLEEILHA